MAHILYSKVLKGPYGRKGPLSQVVFGPLPAPRLALGDKMVAGQRPVGGARPELVRYHLFFGLWDVRLSKVHVAGVLRLKRLLTYISPIDIGL